jgi:hypothetical protein
MGQMDRENNALGQQLQIRNADGHVVRLQLNVKNHWRNFLIVFSLKFHLRNLTCLYVHTASF